MKRCFLGVALSATAACSLQSATSEPETSASADSPAPSTADAGSWSSATAQSSITPPPGGRCANGAPAQVFGTYEDANNVTHSIVGCAGRVSFDQRATLCAPGSAPAAAASWMMVSANASPTHDYWTNDPLGFAGSGSGNCSAFLGSGYSSCGATPMRVCTAAGTDAEGNQCNWTACIYGNYANSTASLGGCAGNTTAGTLCDGAVPPVTTGTACASGAATEYFGTYIDANGYVRGVAGCAGSVTWDQRATACGPGWEPAPAAAWTGALASPLFSEWSGAPRHAYWTNDALGYAGSGSGACSAGTGAGFYSCGANDPMRVCPVSGIDAEGNRCNWTNCGYGGAQSGAFLGGCVGNMTAGVLCQERPLGFTTADGSVTLRSPSNGGTASPHQATLVFAANGADAYSIELTSTPGQYELPDGNPAPGAFLYQVDAAAACTGSACSFVVPDTLAPSTVYQWRVEGFLLGAPGTWSNSNGSDWSFTTLSQ